MVLNRDITQVTVGVVNFTDTTTQHSHLERTHALDHAAAITNARRVLHRLVYITITRCAFLWSPSLTSDIHVEQLLIDHAHMVRVSTASGPSGCQKTGTFI